MESSPSISVDRCTVNGFATVECSNRSRIKDAFAVTAFAKGNLILVLRCVILELAEIEVPRKFVQLAISILHTRPFQCRIANFAWKLYL